MADFLGYLVGFVQSIKDVDDKIILRDRLLYLLDELTNDLLGIGNDALARLKAL